MAFAGPAANRLLAVLAASASERLAPALRPVQLERKRILFRAHEPLRDVYFPISAVVSLVGPLQSGDSLDVGLVGRDGCAGTAVFPGVTTMPCDAIVQIGGEAWQVDAEALRGAVLADPTVYWALCRYVQILLVRSMQLAVCNTFHAAEQRCIRALLDLADAGGDADLPLTHDMLATMVGVHRPTVTHVVRTLDRSGLVEEGRGRIRLRDRLGLEQACCECYATVRDQVRRLTA